MSKITQSAKDELCTLNSPICNRRPETTVFAHLNEHWAGKGIGKKAIINGMDIGFYACDACHNLYDRRRRLGFEAQIDWDLCEYKMVLKAVITTQARLIEKGLLEVK